MRDKRPNRGLEMALAASEGKRSQGGRKLQLEKEFWEQEKELMWTSINPNQAEIYSIRYKLRTLRKRYIVDVYTFDLLLEDRV